MRVRETGKIVGVALSMLLLMGHGLPLWAGEPLDKIRQTVEEVLRIINNEELRAAERTKERREQLRKAVLAHFGFEEMAQRALGRHWQSLNPKQRQEFTTLFGDLLERSYVSKIESYGSGNKVVYPKESIDNDGYATVQSEIIATTNEHYVVEYRMLQRQGSWQVYDVVIEGVSLVNNYRTQFNKIILQESYDALVKKLQQKRDQEDTTLRAQ